MCGELVLRECDRKTFDVSIDEHYIGFWRRLQEEAHAGDQKPLLLSSTLSTVRRYLGPVFVLLFGLSGRVAYIHDVNMDRTEGPNTAYGLLTFA